MTHGQPPRPWPLVFGAGDVGRRIVRLLCAGLLFACLAPGISARLHAWAAEQARASAAGVDACAGHQGHDQGHGALAGCDASSGHADHGVYCGFCVLFSLLPVLPAANTAAGTAAAPGAAGQAARPAQTDVADAVAAWLQQRKHGPPPRG